MSKQIDERVVSMQFDNSNFEKNAQTSLSTLDKLKQALNFDGVGKGLSDLGNVTEAVSGISGFGNAVDTVKDKFSILETIAVGALLKIGSQAVEAGERMVKSLTVDNVAAGFEKYADKTTSVQTIMAATADQFNDTGEQMEFVSEQLDKLNWFTDETSYNFVDMTNNIGKFTSQGIGLEDSVTAMEGIAVWAAQSGQNAEAASRAMYNLSQALGMGAVRAQDWTSVENANMATKEFKEIAIAAGLAAGTIKEGQVTVENFRDSLGAKDTKNWFTKDVLMTTLKQYGSFTDVLKETMTVYEDAGATTSEMLGYMEEYKNGTLDAQAVAEQYGVTVEKLTSDLELLGSAEFELGRKAFKSAQEAKTFEEAIDATKDAVSTAWLNIFETIFGNYLEAKELWTDLANYLYDVFATPVNNLGDLLSEWADFGGRDFLFGSDEVTGVFSHIAEIAESFTGVMKEAWQEIFPPMTGERLAELTKKFNEFVASLKPSEVTLEKLKTIFKGVFAAIDLVGKGIGLAIKAASPLIEIFKKIASAGLSFLAMISEVIIALDSGEMEFDSFADAMDRVKEVFANFGSIGDWIDEIKVSFGEGGGGLSGVLEVIFDQVANLVRGFFELASAITGIDLTGIGENIVTVIQKVRDKVVDCFADMGNNFESFRVSFEEGGGGIAGVFEVFFDVLAGGVRSIGTLVESLTGLDISWIIDPIIESIQKLRDVVVDFVSTVTDINKIKEAFNKLKDTLSEFKVILQPLIDIFKEFVTSIIKGFGDMAENTPMVTLALLIEGLVRVIKALKDEGGKGGFKSLVDSFKDLSGGITDTLGKVGDTLEAIQNKINPSNLTGVGVSIGILAASMFLLAQVDSNRLMSAGIAMTALIGELVGAIQVLTSQAGSVKGLNSLMRSLVLFSAAVAILAFAMTEMGNMNVDNAMAATTAISAMMWELVGITTVMDKIKPSSFMKVAASLVIFAVAVNLIAKPVAALGALPWQQALQGVITLSAIMAGLVVVTRTMGSIDFKTAAGLALIAVGVKLLASAIAQLSALDPLAMVEAMGILLLTMIGLVAAANLLMAWGSGAMQTVGVILAIAVALKMMSSALVELSKMQPEGVGQAIQALAISLGTLVVSCIMLQGVAAGSAGAILVLAAAFLILTAGIMMLAKLEWVDLAKGLSGLAIGLGFLVLIAKEMSASVSGAAAIIIMAGALLILAASLKILGTMNFEELAIGILAICAGLGMLMLIAEAASGSMAGAAAILILATAMVVLAGALLMLSLIPNIEETLGGLAAGLIVLAAAAAGFALASEVLLIGAGVMLALGAAMLVIAAAILIFAGASTVLGVALPILTVGLEMFGQTLNTYLAQFALASAEFIVLGAACIVLGAGLLIAGAGAIVFGVGCAALGVGLAILGAGQVVIEQFGQGLETTAAYIVHFVSELSSVALECVTASAELLLIATAVDLFAISSVALDVALVALALSIGVVDLAIAGLALAVGDCADGIERIGTAFQNIATYGPTAATALGETALALLSAAPDIKKAGEEMAPFATAIEDILTVLNSFNTALLLCITQMGLITAEAVAMSLAISTATLSFTLFVTTLNSFEESALSAFDKVNIAFGVFCVAFLTSISNYGQRIKNMARTLAREIVNDGFKYYLNLNEGKKLGQNFMIGIANGIKDKEGYTTGRAKQAGNAINKTMADTLKVKSPSRIGIWLGQMYDVGIGKGLEKFANRATTPASGVANSINQSMQDALATVMDVFNHDLDSEPTITPVIDITDAQKTLSNLNDMMNLDSVNSLALGFDANQARIMNAPYEQQDLENRLFDRLIKAVTEAGSKETPVNINVDVVQDDQGTFNVTANQNDMYKKRYGKTRFA